MEITKAITHIRLEEANSTKLALLDSLAATYMKLVQKYVTTFCTVLWPRHPCMFLDSS